MLGAPIGWCSCLVCAEPENDASEEDMSSMGDWTLWIGLALREWGLELVGEGGVSSMGSWALGIGLGLQPEDCWSHTS